MAFLQVKWYSTIFTFLMDALLVPWSGQTQLTNIFIEQMLEKNPY
jgi:hypothetical protein